MHEITRNWVKLEKNANTHMDTRTQTQTFFDRAKWWKKNTKKCHTIRFVLSITQEQK